MICTSPRSGSTLLCGLLKETGIAGRPDSHFHEPSFDRWLEEFGLVAEQFASHDEALRAVFSAAHSEGNGGTGVFGLRMQRDSFPYFIEQVDRLHSGRANDVERIEAAFGPTQFIHLTRNDKLAQAVSRTIAEQTGLWHRAADGSELERLAPPQELSYDHSAIARNLAELTASDAAWVDWFAREGVTPLRITYDELGCAPQETLARVLDVLGLDPGRARLIEVPTAKLANATSREWIDRFAKKSAT